MEAQLASINENGGNSVRIYLHWDGIKLPDFESQIFENGYYTESLIVDLRDFLDAAEKNNLFVIISLWNGFYSSSKLSELITDIKVLELYIDKLITPMATALSKHNALAIWEIVYGPDGMAAIGKKDSEKCFDTSGIKSPNNGWTDSNLTMKEVLRFINEMSSALHSASPLKLVTVATGMIDEMLSINHFSNDCLKKAGGHEKGFLDLYVFSVIMVGKEYKEFIPLQNSSAELKFDKPIIITGVTKDFSIIKNRNLADVYLELWKSDYSGCLAASNGTDDQSSVNEGLKSIRELIKKIFINENQLS
jgi:mannan endo-1,4-beta-mannosidase